MKSEKRILVVDNEPHMQRLIQFMLQKTGAVIETVGTGQAAIDSLLQTPADLMIIDYMMPGMDGFETIRILRNQPPLQDMPVIMMTSRGQTVVRESATGLGVAAFFTKPFSPSDLLTEVNRLLAL